LKDIDIDNPTLPVTEGSWLTGAEYQPSFYQYTEPNWDWRQDDEGIRNGLKFEKPKLHRLDAAVYTILNLQGCAMAAKELGKESDYELLCNIAEQFTRQIEEEHWDKQKKMFYDIDLKTGKRCDVSACYDSFAPFMWGIVGEKYFDSINSIFDRNKFWGDFAVSTVEKCNPMYWFDNCIAGPVESSVLSPHHYSASWNGPVWPYANSLVAVALGSVAEQDKRFKAGFLDFFGKWTDLHFLDGDRSVPMTHEHYRQSDGASFSNVVDYFHSSWINPFMTYWAGIRLENGELIFEPLTEEEFSLHGVNIRGKSYNFSQHRENDILKRVMEICK